MAEFEIARVDVIFQDDQLLALTLPAAKFWQPFSQDAGDMAFQNKPHLLTSHFSSAPRKITSGTKIGGGMYKYNFRLSMNANGQEVMVYQHCRRGHTIFVRRALSLRVYLSTSQSQIGVGETTLMISLKKENDVVIFEKEFDNGGSDIPLARVLAVAWRHIIENDHVTIAGKLDVIFQGLLIFEGEGYGDLSTRLSTVLAWFDRQDPSKRRKTSSGSGGRAATPLAEATEVFSLLPPGVAEVPHHTGTTEMSTPPPEIMEYITELRKNNPNAAVISAVRCEFVKGGWIVKFRRGRIEIEEDASESRGLVFNDHDKEP